jgi:hypothetical protein
MWLRSVAAGLGLGHRRGLQLVVAKVMRLSLPLVVLATLSQSQRPLLRRMTLPSCAPRAHAGARSLRPWQAITPLPLLSPTCQLGDSCHADGTLNMRRSGSAHIIALPPHEAALMQAGEGLHCHHARIQPSAQPTGPSRGYPGPTGGTKPSCAAHQWWGPHSPHQTSPCPSCPAERCPAWLQMDDPLSVAQSLSGLEGEPSEHDYRGSVAWHIGAARPPCTCPMTVYMLYCERSCTYIVMRPNQQALPLLLGA